MYGNNSYVSTGIDFFDKLHEWSEKMWADTQNNGYITTRNGRKIYLDWIDDVRQSKVYNYLMQAVENEITIETIYNKLIPLFRNRKSKIILYVYDSILIDTCNDEEYLLKEVKECLEGTGGGYYPVTVSVGHNYDEMREVII